MSNAALTAAVRWRDRAKRAEAKLERVREILRARPDTLLGAAAQNDEARKALKVKEER